MSISLIPAVARRLATWLARAVFVVPLAAMAHNDGAYWHDSGPAGYNPQWMLTIDPGKTLADLSLPGTHDSGTYRGIGGPSARTQTMTIAEQLASGIRWLDIRLRWYDPVLGQLCNRNYSVPDCRLLVFHTIVNQGVEFEPDVLQPVISFLKNNPSELVIMRIATENDDVRGCNCNPGPELARLFEKPAVIDGVATGQKYGDWLLRKDYNCPAPQTLILGPVRPLNAAPDPKSCQARGKLLIIDQYQEHALDRYHYLPQVKNQFDSTPYLQPGYGDLDVIGQFHDNLWLPVKSFLSVANAVPPGPGYLYNTGLSSNGPSFPFFFASGHATEATDAPRLSTGLVQGITATKDTWPDFPRTSCVGSLCTISYEGMNTLAADYLTRPEFHLANSRVGIVNADFPGDRLIKAVAGVNAGVRFNRPHVGYTLKTATGRPYQPGAWTNEPVAVSPVCNTLCTGDRAFVSEDSPDGFAYTVTAGGQAVRIAASPVRIDATRPTISAAVVDQPAINGWYIGNVTVRFTCDDAGGSGVASCPPDQVLTQERTASSSVQFAIDRAGNKSNPSNVVTVNIDKTPPVVTFSGNLGSYAPGDTVDIRCGAVDKESGILRTTCADIRGPASSFGIGTHRFTAQAVDKVGHIADAVTSFTVVALPGDVTADGAIDCRDVALVKASFGKRTGMPGFDARADTNGDGVVDIKDLGFVSQKLPAGTTCP